MSENTDALPLTFLWLELTNKCNLTCVHCCTESSAEAGATDVLTEKDYSDALTQAAALRCPEVQFIGGEPMLNNSLQTLCIQAHELGFSTVQVYTNLTMMSPNLADLFKRLGVTVLTSVYGQTAEVHDSVTQTPGSFSKTIKNMKLLLDKGVCVKPSVISMPVNRADVKGTLEFLAELGFDDVGCDEVRELGRAGSGFPKMSSLCGSCAGNMLSVKPDGSVTPCLLAAPWKLGRFPEQTLEEILNSKHTANTREQIAEATGRAAGEQAGGCNPNGPTCNPDSGGTCNPCSPNGNCGPNDCKPKRSFVSDSLMQIGQ